MPDRSPATQSTTEPHDGCLDRACECVQGLVERVERCAICGTGQPHRKLGDDEVLVAQRIWEAGVGEDRAWDEVERLSRALQVIKERCDRIVAGEYGGMQAAMEISNEARKALRPR